MSKKEKALARLLTRPTDFTWEELKTVLAHFGYEEATNSGSRRKFVNEHKDLIILHKPHPKNVLKRYAIDFVIEHLKERGKLNE